MGITQAVWALLRAFFVVGRAAFAAENLALRRQLTVLSQRQIAARLDEYVRYYNTTRPHLSLNRNSPQPREPDPPANGRAVATPILGGLHHEYPRVA